ncbi:MAG: FAD-binding oxidoreductase [Actinobacteria bacterium]|nr:MAG: FAD-binding oxidoreductase [Actinomycetota bacterium]
MADVAGEPLLVSRLVQPDVLVVGGGIIGTTTAAYLARGGASVTLVERAELASGPSGRSLGLVSGPHPPELRSIAERSLQAYLGLARETGAFTIDANDVGCLCISPDGRGLPRGEGEALDGDQVVEAEPLLALRCAAGVVIPARHVDPGGAVSAWAEEARRHGARIRVACPVRSLLDDGGRVAGAATDEGAIFAGCVVLATGWETPRLAAGLGIDVPVRGVRGWIVTTRPAPFRLRRPINEVDFSAGVVAGPLLTLGDIAEGNVGTPIIAAQMRQDAAGRLVLGASLAPAIGDGDDDGAHAVPSICRRAIELIPPIAEVPIAETRTCVRPASFDGLPLHGPVDGIDGLVLACGHRSHGLTWGPGSGEAVARGVLEGEWDPALSPARLEQKASA